VRICSLLPLLPISFGRQDWRRDGVDSVRTGRAGFPIKAVKAPDRVRFFRPKLQQNFGKAEGLLITILRGLLKDDFLHRHPLTSIKL
jgi:hypothetical protein